MPGNVEKIKNKTKEGIIYALFILCAIINIALFVHNLYYEPEVKTATIVKTDTVVKTDTFVITKEKIKYVDRKIIDTVFIKDETKLFVEQVHVCDTFSDIFVSGILPKVDSVIYKIPEKTIYVDKIVKETITHKESFWKNRFIISAGISAQYGLIHQQFDVGPYIGVGIRLY